VANASSVNRQIVISELPSGRLEAGAFTMQEGEVPEPGEGEVLCRTVLLSIDPANRAWMQGATYTAPVLAGDVMHGFTLAQVVASHAPGIEEGAIVECSSGWQDYAVHAAKDVSPVKVRGPLTQHLSVLGITGLTAYFGLLDVGRPEEGQTVVVSAAAGATGNVVGQIARIKGCRVVGIAGSPEKTSFLVDELGFDAAIDHHTDDLHRALKEACPGGIDVYFDNVGGDVLEAALFRMRQGGRIVCCGVVSQYDTGSPAPGPRGVPGLLVTKRLRMEGFIVMDFFARKEQALDQLADWVASGKLVVHEDVIEGLEKAPDALVGLLAGENIGKRMVRVAELA
jgi:NADPH-dependent curcumin reductase CurA